MLLGGSALHLLAAYPIVSSALSRSNLSAPLQSPFRAVFLMVGWDWIVVAVVILIAAFTRTRIRTPIVLFCGIAVLVQTGIMVRLIGWFIGSEMLLGAGVLIVVGGFLFGPVYYQDESARA